MPTSGKEGQQAPDPFELAAAFFDQHREELRKTYADKYIALLDGRVLDADEDWETLARRVYRR